MERFSCYKICEKEGESMERDILRIRQKPLKGEDGCRTFSVRIREDIVSRISLPPKPGGAETSLWAYSWNMPLTTVR